MASLNEVTQVLGLKNAAHLLRRTTFGPTMGQTETYSSFTPSQALETLFLDEEIPTPPLDAATGESWVNPPTINKASEGVNSEQNTLFSYFKSWHIDVMLRSGLSVKERLTWFYHTHLPAAWTKIQSSEALYYQNCLFRYYALGNFKELFKKICLDNAMLKYIDGFTNHKDAPNENFAREMLELYSIGKGPQLEEGNYTNYTEDDVKSATKVLTGWLFDEDFVHLDKDTGIPSGKLKTITATDGTTELATAHDASVKTFSSLFDSYSVSPATILEGYPTAKATMQEFDDMIEMIFGKIETARFIMRKLYRSFVYHFISDEVETDIIQPLAQIFYDNDYEIRAPLEVLFKSEHFYDLDNTITADNNIGALIKSPVDVTLGLLRFFETETPDRNIQTNAFYDDFSYIDSVLKEQGIEMYDPYDVAGFDPYHQMPGFARNWIMTYELAKRYQIGDLFMKRAGNPEDLTFSLNVLDWVENSGNITDPSDATEIVTVLTENLLAVELSTERFDYFLNTIFLDTLPTTTWTMEWNAYSDGGSNSVVKNRIETLVSALVQTPEFQVY
ncbi:MAG: DUF1800 family protein [Bacteroidales bacterium]|nr:DUF1800 family protein [Bacteroidales bacterium]MBN2819134.1 DUF1800 family protein [Bacteroidales bacterium]